MSLRTLFSEFHAITRRRSRLFFFFVAIARFDADGLRAARVTNARRDVLSDDDDRLIMTSRCHRRHDIHDLSPTPLAHGRLRRTPRRRHYG